MGLIIRYICISILMITVTPLLFTIESATDITLNQWIVIYSTVFVFLGSLKFFPPEENELE